MNPRTLRTSLFSAAALGLGALWTPAAADPGVVVMSFEGEMNLAVSVRSEIISIVDRDYEVVPQRAWREALEQGGRAGRAAWAAASKETSVAATIEGSVSRGKGGGTLRLVVRDAHNGKTIEELSAPLGKDGLTDKGRSQLEVALGDALFSTGDALVEEKQRQDADDAADRKRGRGRDGDAADDDGDRDASARASRVSEVKVDVAAAAETTRKTLFEAPLDDGSAAPTPAAKPALPRVPIADLSLYGSAISRQFGFTGADLPADYPGATVTSIGLSAAVYPTSKRDGRGRLNGLGVSAAVASSVASDVPVDIDGEVFDFPVTQKFWQIDAHYRYPAGAALIDGHVGYASLTHYVEDIPEDAALELDLLDAEYGFLDFGARVEIDAGPRTTLGFSASYLHMLQVGVVTDPDLLGNAQAWGMKAGLDLKIQLGAGMFAGAGADYRRVSMIFDGDGELYQDVDVDDAKDTFIGGHLELGVVF